MSPHESKEPDQHEHESSCWFVTNKDLDRKLDLILRNQIKIMLTQEQEDALLASLNTATNKLAANIQVIADTDQTISTEIDTLLKQVQPGTVMTDAQVKVLQDAVTTLQATSDASDAQVAVLKAIATKGATNPVPVPVPPPPTP